jgi:hypothetical protein
MSKSLIFLALVVLLATVAKAQEDYDALFQINENDLEYYPSSLSTYRNFTICQYSNSNLCLYATPTNSTLYWANNYYPSNPLYGFVFAANATGYNNLIRKPGCSTLSNTRDVRTCGVDFIHGRSFRSTGNVLLHTNNDPRTIMNYTDWQVILDGSYYYLLNTQLNLRLSQTYWNGMYKANLTSSGTPITIRYL